MRADGSPGLVAVQQNLLRTPGFARSPDPRGSLPSRGVKSSVGHTRTGPVRTVDRLLAATRLTTFPLRPDDFLGLVDPLRSREPRLRVGSVRDLQTGVEHSAPAHGDGEPVRTCVSAAVGDVEIDL